MKPKTRLEILKGLSDIEYGISKGGNDKIQTSAIIGVIKDAMEFGSIERVGDLFRSKDLNHKCCNKLYHYRYWSCWSCQLYVDD